MEQSLPIKDPQTFRNQHQNQKQSSFAQNQTALNSLHLHSLLNQSQQNNIHCICGKSNSKDYSCQICNRLRLACPYSSKYTMNQARRNTSQNKFNKNVSFKQQKNPKITGIQGCKFCNQSHIYRKISNQHINHYPKINKIPPPPQTFIQQKRPLVIEQIIYYPVFHNIYHDRNAVSPVKNPQSVDRYSKLQETFASPEYKYKHRCSTNQPQSSPIKVEQYEQHTIMTPEKIKKLTESMIN